MTAKVIIWAGIGILLTLLVIQQINIFKQVRDQKDPNYELLQAIDSLKMKIDSLQIYRDSLQSVVDTSKVKIIEVEKRYETIRDRIINQSMDSDCITFSNYLSNYQRFSDSNDSSSIKNN